MQPHIICIRLTLQKKNMRMLRIHFNQRHSVCEKEVINLRKNAHILKTRTMASINCVILLSHIPFPPIENPPLKYQNTNYWLQKLQKSAKLILFSMFFSMLIIMLILVIYTKNPWHHPTSCLLICRLRTTLLLGRSKLLLALKSFKLWWIPTSIGSSYEFCYFNYCEIRYIFDLKGHPNWGYFGTGGVTDWRPTNGKASMDRTCIVIWKNLLRRRWLIEQTNRTEHFWGCVWFIWVQCHIGTEQYPCLVHIQQDFEYWFLCSVWVR